MNLDQAIELARRFHADQIDKAGRPYIEHVLRVVDAVHGPDEKLAAALHDLLEDTVLTATDLRCAGVPARVVAAVESLTRGAGESYEEFIRRAVADPVARVVKLADLGDNADESRLARLPTGDAVRLRAKYAAAVKLLHSLDPLDEALIGELRAVESGVPAGAAELGIPRGVEEEAATFWCAESECGRPAGTLTLIRVEEPGFSGRLGRSLVLTTFLGTMAPSVTDGKLELVRAALAAADAAFFYRWDTEYVPFWCMRCTKTYCAAHWRLEHRFDDGFFDCIRGSCPKGHERTLWD